MNHQSSRNHGPLEALPFGFEKTESFSMWLKDDGASIELMYDRLSVSYHPRVGDRVLVIGEIKEASQAPSQAAHCWRYQTYRPKACASSSIQTS